MKKLVLVLVLVVAGLCFADWDTIPVPQAAKDIIDTLLPLPANVAKEYGSTEKVRLIHHLLVLKAEVNKVFVAQKERIVALEKQVAAITKPETQSAPQRQKVEIPELGLEGEFDVWITLHNNPLPPYYSISALHET